MQILPTFAGSTMYVTKTAKLELATKKAALIITVLFLHK